MPTDRSKKKPPKKTSRFQVKPEEVAASAAFTFVTVIEQVGGWDAWSALHDLIDAKFPAAAKEYERQNGSAGRGAGRPEDHHEGLPGFHFAEDEHDAS